MEDAMSDIKVGDLVMVVRGMTCCGAITGSEGAVFQVTELAPTVGKCLVCRSSHSPGTAHSKEVPAGIDLDRLRKIEPLSREDSIETTKQDHMDIKV